MKPEEFNTLNANDRAFVVEGYLDGFKAAIECVESIIVRIGEPTIDKLFISNRDMIAATLQQSLAKMNEVVKDDSFIQR
jgi:hypothetical protein